MRPTPAGIPEGFSRPKTAGAVYGMIIAARFRTGYGCRMVDDISTEEFSAWLMPREALRLADGIMDEATAMTAIVDRLHSEKIAAVAELLVVRTTDSAIREPDLRRIPGILWGAYGNSNSESFWRTGDITFRVPIPDTHEFTYVKYFGIRFHRNDLYDLFPERRPKESSVLVADGVSKPSVSDALLTAWYDLYLRAYTGAADTEANAVQSAQGMFPGKSVSRERVRELRGERMRGRPKGDRGTK